MDFTDKLRELKESGEAPEWMDGHAYQTLSKGYLLSGETPRQMYHRIAKAAAARLGRPKLAEKFYDLIDRNWLCPATPVAANMGTTKGMPISCFGQAVSDSVYGIGAAGLETMILTKNGGGIGKYWGEVRAAGTKVGSNGHSKGIIPWLTLEEKYLSSVSQGDTRGGAGAQYLDITHGDFDDFIDIRRQTGDADRRCRSKNFHHAVVIDDPFMEACKAGDRDARERWSKVLKTRVEMGEPYVMFRSNANNNRPECYKHYNLHVKASQLCSEIALYSDPDHTYVCCLSSMNLARYDEWKDTEAVQLSIWFLDGVMQEFIDKAKEIQGFENAVRFAEKSRALGLGVLGWHTLLQERMVPWESFDAMMLNAEVFRYIRNEAEKATKDLAKEFGEVEWTKGFNRRNTHLLAVAPTVSNSINAGGISQGIEPWAGNIFSQDSAKGNLIRKNPSFVKLLQAKGKDTFEVWDKVNMNGGSAVGLDFLSDHEKDVFKTAREINQFALINQAAQRQKYIDQGQSLNLFFAKPDSLSAEDKQKLAKYIHEVHWMAWEQGLYSLYYLRSESMLKGDAVYREASDCASCEG